MAKTPPRRTSTRTTSRAKSSQTKPVDKAAPKNASATVANNPSAKLSPKPKTIDLDAKDVVAKSTSKALDKPATAAKTAKPKTTTSRAKSSAQSARNARKKRIAFASPIGLFLSGIAGGLIVLLGGLALWGSGAIGGKNDAQAGLKNLLKNDQEQTSKLDALQESDDQLDTRLTSIGIQQEQAAQIQSAMNETNSNLFADLSQAAGASQEELDNRIAALQNEIGEIDTKSSSILSEQSALQQSLSDAEAERSGLKAQFDELVKSLLDGQAGEGPALAVFEDQLIQLNNQQDVLMADIARLTQTAADQDTFLANLNADLTTAQNSSFAEFEEQLAALRSKLLTLEEQNQILVLSSRAKPIELTEQARKLNYLANGVSRVVKQGTPFPSLLADGQQMMHEVGLVPGIDNENVFTTSLKAIADKGVYSLPEWAVDISQFVDSFALTPIEPATDGAGEVGSASEAGLLNSFMKSTTSLIKIRNLNDQKIMAPDTLESQIKSLLNAASQSASLGDVESVARQLGALQAIDGGQALSDQLAEWRPILSEHLQVQKLQQALTTAEQYLWSAQISAAEGAAQ